MRLGYLSVFLATSECIAVFSAASDVKRSCCRPAVTQIPLQRPSYSHSHKGEVWIQSADVVKEKGVQRFVLQVRNSEPAYIPGYNATGYSKSGDGGLTWSKGREAPSSLDILGSALERAPADPRVIYRIDQDADGLYLRSDDGGDRWVLPEYKIEGVSKETFAYSMAGSRYYHVSFRLAAIDPRDPHTLYASIRIVQWSSSLIRLRPPATITYLDYIFRMTGARTGRSLQRLWATSQSLASALIIRI